MRPCLGRFRANRLIGAAVTAAWRCLYTRPPAPPIRQPAPACGRRVLLSSTYKPSRRLAGTRHRRSRPVDASVSCCASRLRVAAGTRLRRSIQGKKAMEDADKRQQHPRQHRLTAMVLWRWPGMTGRSRQGHRLGGRNVFARIAEGLPSSDPAGAAAWREISRRGINSGHDCILIAQARSGQPETS